jgi:outer membrane lipoprotein-sorting protein
MKLVNSRSLRVTIAALVLAAGSASFAQPATTAPATPAAVPAASAEKLPSGDEVLDKFINAIGGKEAIEKIKSRTTVSKIEFVGMGVSGTTTIQQVLGGKALSTTELAGLGKFMQGSDGKVLWDNNPMQGPRVLDGDERAMMVRTFTLNSELRRADFYSKFETVGVEQINGKDAYKVEATPKTGVKETQFYDKESGLLVKTVSTLVSQMGEIKLESTVADYREVDGIKIPFKTSTIAGPQNLSITIEKVTHNAEIPDATFDLPKEIKELIEATKKSEPAATPAPASPK